MNRMVVRGVALAVLLVAAFSAVNSFRMLDSPFTATIDNNLGSARYTAQNVWATVFPAATEATTATVNGVVGSHPRVYVGILAYASGGATHVPKLMDSLQDLCESGAHVHVAIYTSAPWDIQMVHELNARVCVRNPADLEMAIHIYDPQWKTALAAVHRQHFYHLVDSHIASDNYDIFVYTEDDLWIRPTHVAAYLHETRLLQALVGPERLADYSLGFLRYELSATDASRVIWEHGWDTSTPGFRQQHMIHVPAYAAHASAADKNGSRSRTLQEDGAYYFNGAGTFHQGMYMATPQQLRLWRERPGCHFNETAQFLVPPFAGLREKMSSLQLFRQCNVTQLLPLRSFPDFLVQHMGSTQHTVLHRLVRPRGSINNVSPRELHQAIARNLEWLANHNSSSHGRRRDDTTTTSYKGLAMFADDRRYKDFAPNNSIFEEYVANGGRLP